MPLLEILTKAVEVFTPWYLSSKVEHSPELAAHVIIFEFYLHPTVLFRDECFISNSTLERAWDLKSIVEYHCNELTLGLQNQVIKYKTAL